MATIILRKESGGAFEVATPKGFPSEAELQKILVTQPSLLAGVGETALAVEELEVPGIGFADVVAVDQDGSVTICECKLEKNPDIKRRVIGQILAYGAGLRGLSFAELDQRWQKASANDAKEASLNRWLATNGSVDSIQRMEQTLASGSFNLVIAVDSITDELRHIVEFLSSHTDSTLSVVLMEFQFFDFNGTEVLVPQAFGAELAEAKKPQPAAWNEERFFESLDQIVGARSEAVRGFYKAFDGGPTQYVFGKGRQPSVTAQLTRDTRLKPFSIWVEIPHKVTISVNFAYLRSAPPETAQELFETLCKTPSIEKKLQTVKGDFMSRRPSLDLAEHLADDDSLRALEQALHEFVAAQDS